MCKFEHWTCHTKLPWKTKCFPNNSSRLALASKKATQDWLCTTIGKIWIKNSRIERAQLYLSGKENPREISPFFNANLPANFLENSKVDHKKKLTNWGAPFSGKEHNRRIPTHEIACWTYKCFANQKTLEGWEFWISKNSREHYVIKWKDDSASMELPCNDVDRKLFHACTKIILGNGKKTFFWKDNWLQGQCPKDLPNLFNLAIKKNRTISVEIHNNS